MRNLHVYIKLVIEEQTKYLYSGRDIPTRETSEGNVPWLKSNSLTIVISSKIIVSALQREVSWNFFMGFEKSKDRTSLRVGNEKGKSTIITYVANSHTDTKYLLSHSQFHLFLSFDRYSATTFKITKCGR